VATTRILLIRTSALGDVVQALPVLTALRRNLPSARIAWLVEDVYTPILEGHPDLDEVIPVRLRAWRKRLLSPRTWAEVGAFLSALDRFAPEVVLDLMGNHKAGILAAATLADRRIGLDRSFRREPSSCIWITDSVRPESRHSVDKMLAVLSALGLPSAPAAFDGEKIPAGLAVAATAETQTAARVLIHPGAGWGNKRYPPEAWGEVARLLHDSHGVRAGILVGLGEEQLAEAVAQASYGSAEVFWAPDLHQLGSLLRQADLVIGGDTGPVHLAHALGRPVLCLMGPTDPETCGPYGAIQAVVWRRLPCSFCHQRYDQTMPCLAEVPPSVIAERAGQLLQGQELPPAGPIDEGEAGCPIFH